MAKVRMGLLGSIIEPLAEVANVIEHGLVKYGGTDGWRGVSRDYHVDALMRHVAEALQGSRYDSESGLHPLAHAACRCLYIIWLDEHEAVAPVVRGSTTFGVAAEDIQAGRIVAIDSDGYIKVAT